ncbi:tRNA (guanosine(46)-N7)-methyltransferase TrmB [soil metagenome]
MNDDVAQRTVRSYVLRAGRIGPGQQRALDTLSERFVLPYAGSPLDASTVFGNDRALILEIGFGMGETTADIAANQPDRNFLGVEVHIAGVGALLKRIEERQLENLRIVRHDAVEVVEHMLAAESLAGVHVFFPDPWHKKRHNKRRLIQPAFVGLLASRLAPGGYLHCATDWPDYADQMLAVLGAEPLLENTCTDFAERPEHRPFTKFERRGINLGHPVKDLMFRRRPIP